MLLDYFSASKTVPDGLTQLPPRDNSALLIWQDMTIIVADDVPPIIFSNNKKYGKKVIVWKIKDIPSQEGTEAEKKKLIKKIMKKVDGLNKNLQKELKWQIQQTSSL